MYFAVDKLINHIPDDEPDPKAANALQEGVGGQFGEMRTMMQYLFQSFNFRGDAKPYRDLIHSVAVEEISHLELITTTVSRLLDGSPRYQGKTGDVAAAGGTTPLEVRSTVATSTTSSSAPSPRSPSTRRATLGWAPTSTPAAT